MTILKKSKALVDLIRPYQWIKNGLVFSPIFFSGNINDQRISITTVAALCFVLASSMGYIVNDWVDLERDKFHQEKTNRPLSSGAVSKKEATALFLFLLIVLFVILTFFPFADDFYFVLTGYACLTFSYSFYFKKVPLFEIFCVALGFVLRVMAGGSVTRIDVSGWLFLTVFFMAMMISVAKRLNELELLGPETAAIHRSTQAHYSTSYLRQLLWSCACITLVVYAIYAVEHNQIIKFSVVPAAYGIFRFLHLAEKKMSRDPIKALFLDRQLFIVTLAFLFALTFVIYR